MQTMPSSQMPNAPAVATPEAPLRPAPAEYNYRGVEAVVRTVGRLISAFFGWVWRIFVGSLFCTNLFLSIFVVGWLYRWIQWRALRVWWKQGRAGREGSFDDFCNGLGVDAPVPRPRWFLRDHFRWERIQAELKAPTWDGEPPGFLRVAARALIVPVRSLWLNFGVGLAGLFCTYSLTCWGALLMTCFWEFGWLNSFHKGYELSWAGPTFSLLGILLFVAAMFYVPMGQVHQAVTGDMRAFYDFRFVWQLIRARLTAYVLYAAGFLVIAMVLEVFKIAAVGSAVCNLPGDPTAADLQAAQQYLQQYYWFCGLLLFLALLLTRRLMVSIYCSAVLKVLRRGRVRPEELHPKLGRWLDRMGVLPTVQPHSDGILLEARKVGRNVYRGFLWTALFLIWLTFFGPKVYVGEFLNYHPLVGFMNHPLIQFPAYDYIPHDILDPNR
jgi:hypothetical protein